MIIREKISLWPEDSKKTAPTSIQIGAGAVFIMKLIAPGAYDGNNKRVAVITDAHANIQHTIFFGGLWRASISDSVDLRYFLRQDSGSF